MWDKSRQLLSALPRNLGRYALQTTAKNLHIVNRISVVVEILDDAAQRTGWFGGIVNDELAGVSEVFQDSDRIKHDKMAFLDVLALSRASAKHLFEKDARLHRTDE